MDINEEIYQFAAEASRNMHELWRKCEAEGVDIPRPLIADFAMFSKGLANLLGGAGSETNRGFDVILADSGSAFTPGPEGQA